MWAAAAGKIDVLEKMIDLGAEVDARDMVILACLIVVCFGFIINKTLYCRVIGYVVNLCVFGPCRIREQR